MKKYLEHQFEAWQDIIDSREASLNSWFELRRIAETNKDNFENKIQRASSILSLEENVPKKSLGPLREELNQFKAELKDKLDDFCDQLHQQVTVVLQRSNDMPDSPEVDIQTFYDSEDEEQGLNPERIEKFDQFTADERFVDDQCMICFADIEIGRNMMRLDCNSQHTFCQVCIEGWFDDNKTCPICGHRF